jgi:hypothetical protein
VAVGTRGVEEIHRRCVTVRHGTHLRERSDFACDRVHGTSTAVKIVVDGDRGAVEEERADGCGVRVTRRAFGLVASLVVERAWSW